MALTGRKVSVKNIIAKVFRDLDLREEADFINMLEWSAEALDHIAVFDQLETKFWCTEVNFYKAELPCDMVYINSISVNGENLKPATNPFGSQHLEDYNTNADSGLAVNIDKVQNAAYAGLLDLRNHNNSYTIANGYIKLAKKDGTLSISYQAMPTDEEGYPLIPDEVSFREAVYRYIVYKWMYPQVLKGKIDPRMLADAEQKWNWYCNQAGAKAMMPDQAKLENIKRNYLKLKPDLYRFDSFFNNI